MKKFWLIWFLIGFSAVADAQTTVGGPTAPPPLPDQISSVNQAQNPGFETGSLTDWTASSGCIAVTSSQHHSGSFAAQFNTCSGGTDLSQSIAPPTWGSGSPAQYPEALSISFWAMTDASFNGSLTFRGRWLKGYLSAGSFYNPVLWKNNKATTRLFGNQPWTKYTAYLFLDPTAISGSSTDIQVQFHTTNNLGSPAGNLWIDDVTFSWCWSSTRTLITYPNYKGLLWDDQSQVITGVTELTPKVGTTSAASLTIKLASAAGCASPITTDTISTPTLFNPTTAYPQVQAWSINTTSLGLSTGTAHYVCTTATWSDSTTTTYPDFMVVPFSHTLRASFGNYIDTDGAWVHNTKRQVAWGTFDNWSSKYRIGSAIWSGVIGVNSNQNCSPSQSPPWLCFVHNVQSFGNQAPSVIAGIPGLTYEAPTATSGLMADYAANGFTWVENSASIYANADPTPSGENNLTALLTALDNYGVANSQIMNSYWGSIATSTRTGGSPSSPSLREVSGRGTFTSGTLVFVEVTGIGTPGGAGSGARMGETLPTGATSVRIANSNDSVQVILPSCLSSAASVPASQAYRWAGFSVYAATNSSSAPPAQSSFYTQNFGGALPCGGTFTFGSIAQPSQADTYGPSPNPPTTDTTSNAGSKLGSYTDWQDWQQFAYAQSVIDAQANTHPQGAAAEYVFDEPVMNWLGDGYYFVDAQRQWAPDVLTWATNNDNRTNRYWRDLFDVISSDPYGYSYLNSDEVYTGTDTRTAYMPGVNNAITQFRASVGLVDYWTDFNGRTTYGARPQVNVISLLEDGGVYGYSYPEMRRQYYKAMIGCQAWGGLGCGVLSYGWGESDGLEFLVFTEGSTNTYTENYQALKEIEALTPQWLTTTADTSVLSIGTGQVSAGGVNVINRETESGPGIVVSNVQIGTAVSTVCAGGYTNATVYPFGPVRFVTKQMPNGDQWIIATNLCSASSNFNVTFTLSNPPGSTAQLYGTDDPVAGSPEDPNGQYGNGTPGNPSPHARTFTLTNNAFTDSWRDEDVHVYVIHATAPPPPARLTATPH